MVRHWWIYICEDFVLDHQLEGISAESKADHRIRWICGIWRNHRRNSGGLAVLQDTFTNSDFAPNNVALIPTQIYSGFLDFAHFLLLLYVAKHKKADGQVAACYLIFYSIGRFVIEFFRGDIERGSVGVLSTSQFISIFTTVAGIILLLTVVKKQKQEANISLNSKG